MARKAKVSKHARWRSRAKKALAREPSTLVISRWLNLCQVGHWTPFEAALEIKKELEKAGYMIVVRDTIT